MASSDAREENVYLAKVAERAERFEEMLEFVEKAATAASSEGKDLTVEERHLISVAYKNVVGARRAAWRILMSIERSEEKRCNSDRAATIRDYRAKIESELSSLCGRILRFLDSLLIPSAAAPDSKVCFLKMKGDHLRYLAEFKTGTDRKEVAENTLTIYKSAQEIAAAQLPPTHPTRLGLALNFCVFYYEIMGSPDQACTLANQALKEANEAGTETSDHGPSKENAVIMQLLRDNIAIWATELQDDDMDDDNEGSPMKNSCSVTAASLFLNFFLFFLACPHSLFFFSSSKSSIFLRLLPLLPISVFFSSLLSVVVMGRSLVFSFLPWESPLRI